MSANMPPIPDAGARTRALDPNASLIVQAPAGSGKTTLLATRYVHLLTRVSRPEEILAITFTRKAAAEMRHRVTALLKEDTDIAQQIRNKNDNAGWHLFDNPNVMKIQTIDSFALEIAGQTPHLASTAGLSITHHPAKFYNQASKNLLARLYENDPTNPIIAQFLSFLDNDADKAERLVSFMLSRRDQWITAVTTVAQQQQLSTTARLLNIAIEQLRVEITEQLNSLLNQQDLQTLSLLSAELGLSDHFDSILPTLLTKAGKLRKQLTAKDGINNGDLKKLAKAWLVALHERGVADRIIGYCKLPQPIDLENPVDLNTLQVSGICLSLAAIELDQLFQAQGTIDFTGVLIRAKQALEDEHGPTDLALYLDYRIQHILIDEYQDTSQAQFEFFNLLTRGWHREDNNTFFVVGDPMQSIYRFRDADVAIFNSTKSNGLETISLDACHLTSNFRSQAAVVDWCNGLFERIFSESSAGQLGEVTFHSAQSLVPSNGKARVDSLQFDSEEHETQYVLEHVQRLLDTHPDDDIAILCRARNHLRTLLAEFTRLGIPVQATDMDQLSDTPIISDLMSLHAAYLDRFNPLAWFSLLRSPMFGVTLPQLTQLNETGDPVAEILSGTANIPQLTRLHEALCWAAPRLYEVPIREILEGLWFRCGGQNAYEELQWPHAMAWFELIDDLGQDAYDTDLVAEAVQSLFAQSQQDANVKVMTIHKAKGLEFEHVVIPYLNKRAQNDEAQLIQWRASGSSLLMGVRGSEVHDWLSFEERQRAANEEKRLLYVACTRAKSTLLTTYNCEPSKSPAGLAKWLEHSSSPANNDDKSNDQSKQVKSSVIATHSRRLPVGYNWQMPDYGACLPNNLIEPIARQDQLSARYEVALGLLIHEALAWFATSAGQLWLARRANSEPTDTEIDLRIHSWLQHLPISADNHTNLSREAKAHIDRTLTDSNGQWVLKTHEVSHSEWPLGGVIDNTVVRVIIDRIFVDEGICWIIDFKTSQPQSGEKHSDFVDREVMRYRAQLDKYRHLADAIFHVPVKTALYFTSLGHLHQL